MAVTHPRFTPIAALIVIASLFGVLTGSRLAAQPLDSVRKMYRLPSNRFFIGAWCSAFPTAFNTTGDYGSVDALWSFLQSLHVDGLQYMANPEWGDDGPAHTPSQVDSLMTFSTLRGARQFLIVKNVTPVHETGWGREGLAFPFDSTRSSVWQVRFASRDSLAVAVNTAMQPLFNRKDIRESAYSAASGDTANQPIASHVTYDWHPAQLHRFAQYESSGVWHSHDADSVQNSDEINAASSRQSGADPSKNYFVVFTGRARYQGGTVDDGDPLFLIDVVQEVDRGLDYRSCTGVETADDNVERVCTTLAVTKGMLAPASGDRGEESNWLIFREAVFEVPMDQCAGCAGGPLDDSTASRRFDLRVRWAGNEPAVMHSLAVRTERAQQIMGHRTADTNARDSLLRNARRIIFGRDFERADTAGAAWKDSVMTLRPVVALTSAGEQIPPEAPGVTAVTRFLKENFQYRGDSLSAWLEDGDQPALHDLADHPEAVTVEVGPWEAFAPGWDSLGLTTYMLPEVRSHNGGRFATPGYPGYAHPVLGLTRDSIESYEASLQRLRYGLNCDDSLPSYLGRGIRRLARASDLARDRYRPLVPIVFTSNNVEIADRGGDTTLDTIIAHIPEPAELRLWVNLAAAYGARGVMWQTLDGARNFATAGAIDSGAVPPDTTWIANFELGVNGGFTLDTASRFADSLWIYSRGSDSRCFDALPRLSIRDYYTGWGARTREIGRISQWLADSIGDELLKLRWKDAYSIHYTSPLPFDTSLAYRPLPIDCVVRRITAHDVSTGVADDPEHTYVELGLFETINAAGYPRRDTMHIYLVNRRCLERSDELSSQSGEGRAMDSLAENRRLRVQLNLQRFDQYHFARVQEIRPDLTPLAGHTGARHRLDTIVNVDSTFVLDLGPGRGSLLRITLAPPDESFELGDIRRSSQRKLVFDGTRYHAVYRTGTDSSVYDTVYYRRSYPFADTSGSIMWEPKKWPLSEIVDEHDSLFANRYPSITVQRSGSSVIGTVVWVTHAYSMPAMVRSVVVRRLLSTPPDTGVNLAPDIEFVADTVIAPKESEWGTPVICRVKGGEIIAWSDSIAGIRARVRRTGKGSWIVPGEYSNLIDASALETILYAPGMFPTVPTFAHIRSLDSNCGLAWQQPIGANTNDILYKRLVQLPDSAGVPRIVCTDTAIAVTAAPGRHFNPSIDQMQDYWQEVQDAVTWETVEGFPPQSQRRSIQYRSVFTETRSRPGWDLIEPSRLWGWARHFTKSVLSEACYPNIAAVIARDSADAVKSMSTIAFNVINSIGKIAMYEASMQWADLRLRTPRDYTFGGRHLSVSAMPDTSQRRRHAVLYESSSDTAKFLRTTREFFLGRARPLGYVAHGRHAVIVLSSPTRAAIDVMLNDVWYATDAGGSGVELAGRDTSREGNVDSLAVVESLLRSTCFAASDSVLVGCEAYCGFTGDTTGLSGLRLSLVIDLADSATDERVALLDSVAISTASQPQYREISTTLDLLSGTYYVRTRIDTLGAPVIVPRGDTRYPVCELSSLVEDTTGLARLNSRRSSPPSARVSVRPNPAAGPAEVFFSIPEASRVSLVVHDETGRRVATYVEPEWLERGRYAIAIDVGGLPPGRYLVELRTSSQSIVTKLVVGQ